MTPLPIGVGRNEPFPIITKGRAALASSSAASSTRLGSGKAMGGSGHLKTSTILFSSTCSLSKVAGKSRNATPGLPYVDNLTAFSTCCGISPADGGLAAYLQYGLEASTCGYSWNPPIPSWSSGHDPARTINGLLPKKSLCCRVN
ncbi:Protein of unknown function [Cotesia congregata]|uniref:Uncharacterized protein n=1 Tax=Cotesia congregata TaxID=51543 RepID=A0A8J2E195_COTCN|nr:Protein of unknown function [Cotesia congregata]